VYVSYEILIDGFAATASATESFWRRRSFLEPVLGAERYSILFECSNNKKKWG